MTVIYLSTSEVARRIGVTEGTMRGYIRKGLLPIPDAQTGRVYGWLPATIDTWQANRPGRGARSDLRPGLRAGQMRSVRPDPSFGG